MTREWKPGDVVAIRNGDEDLRAMVTTTSDDSYASLYIETEGGACLEVGLVEAGTMRPLFVIDPEDREQVERLCAVMKSNGWTDIDDDAPSDMQTVLRSFVAPPKPDEPKGLGAVVEDDERRRWTRSGHGETPWHNAEKAVWVRWDQVAAFRVLSEGVA